MTRKNIENAIQAGLIRWVKQAFPHIRVLAIRNEDMRHRPNEIEPGHPDLELQAICGGLCYILKLELKRKAGKLNQNQIEWNERFDANPAFNLSRAVAYGLQEAEGIVANWVESLRQIAPLPCGSLDISGLQPRPQAPEPLVESPE